MTARQVALLLCLAYTGRTAIAQTIDLQGAALDGATGAPLAGVLLTFKGEYAAQGEHSATSDSQGAFRMPRVPLGRYVVEAERDGYLPAPEWKQSYLTVTATGPDRPLTVKLAREAAVSGIVVDEDGAPVPSAEVVLADLRAQGGSMMARTVRANTTDAAGRFRLDKITPGKYFLHAAEDRFLATWFPGTVDALAAAPVIVFAGADVSGLRIKMRRGALHTVSGKVEGASPGVAWSVFILAAADPSSMQPLFMPNGPVHAPGSRLRNDGTFSVSGVAPGPAIVWVKKPDDAQPLATASVLVGNDDVGNVRIFVPPPVTFAGKIVYADGREWKHKGYQFSLAGMMLGGIRTPVDVGEDGSFTAQGLTAGTYRVLTGSDSEFVVRIELGPKVVEGSRLELTPPGSEQVVIALSVYGASLDGSVEGSFTPDSPAHGVVSIIEKPGSALELTSLRVAPVLPAGTFLLRKMPPGDYLVCGWSEDSEPAEIMTNPRYREKLEQACTSVKLKVGEHGQVRVRQLRAAEIER